MASGERRVVPVSGGNFEGDRLRGTVLPHAGSDWLLGRADGRLPAGRAPDARDARRRAYSNELSRQDQLRRSGSKLARGEQVGRDSEYYLRTAPFFETGDKRYAWLNTIVSVGVGERLPNGAAYDIFEVL